MNLPWLSLFLPWLVADLVGGAVPPPPHQVQVITEAKAMAESVRAQLGKTAERDAKEVVIALAAERTRGDRLAAQLAEQQRKNRRTTDRLIGEIARVNDLYREALDAQPKPVPACVFTHDWVRIYDEATGAAMPSVRNTSGDAPSTGKADAPGQLSAGVNASQVLAHHVRYAEQCRNTASQLNLLIDRVKGK